MFVRGALGGSGRKQARKAARFLGSGGGGFLTASTLLAAAGVAWGIYDSLQAQQPAAAGGAPPVPGAPIVPPVPASSGATSPGVPPDVARVVRLAVSAANADGGMGDAERAVIMERAARAGIGPTVEAELQVRRPLTDIVAGVSAEAERRDLYALAFTIVRADESVSGAERIYLAQLAHALGLTADAAATLERDTAAAIDTSGTEPA
jgi:uncharacterized membrane protein YebE (DUF533 family)